MTPYVKKQAVKEALELVRKEIATDKQFGQILNNLWRKATDQKFTADSVRKIQGIYLTKAKTLLPDAIKQIRREVLKDTGQRVASNSSNKQGQVTRGSSTPQRSSGKSEGINKVTRNMSTLDIFNQD
jgi:hypothetical protein